MLREELFDGYYINCNVIQMGNDYTIAVYGGDTPHVGSVVMSTARPSLTGKGTGVTSSVINGSGHKDEVIARMFAETLAEKWKCTVVCSCGIHIDNITFEQIQRVKEISKRMIEQVFVEEKAEIKK